VVRQVVGVLVVGVDRHRRTEVAHVGAFAEELAEHRLAESVPLTVFVEIVIAEVDLLKSVFK